MQKVDVYVCVCVRAYVIAAKTGSSAAAPPLAPRHTSTSSSSSSSSSFSSSFLDSFVPFGLPRHGRPGRGLAGNEKETRKSKKKAKKENRTHTSPSIILLLAATFSVFVSLLLGAFIASGRAFRPQSFLRLELPLGSSSSSLFWVFFLNWPIAVAFVIRFFFKTDDYLVLHCPTQSIELNLVWRILMDAVTLDRGFTFHAQHLGKQHCTHFSFYRDDYIRMSFLLFDTAYLVFIWTVSFIFFFEGS